jgi:hypothetical protein
MLCLTGIRFHIFSGTPVLHELISGCKRRQSSVEEIQRNIVYMTKRREQQCLILLHKSLCIYTEQQRSQAEQRWTPDSAVEGERKSPRKSSVTRSVLISNNELRIIEDRKVNDHGLLYILLFCLVRWRQKKTAGIDKSVWTSDLRLGNHYVKFHKAAELPFFFWFLPHLLTTK